MNTTKKFNDGQASSDLNLYGGILDILLVIAITIGLGILGTRIGLTTMLGGGIVNLGYVAGVLAAGYLLKLRGSGWREIGLAKPKSWSRTVLLAIAAMIGAIFMTLFSTELALNLMGEGALPPDISRFNVLVGNFPMLLLLLTLAWTTIAFGEEMIYRAFLISRLGEVFNNSKFGWNLAALINGVIFGLVHFAEGPVGMISNGAFGLLFGFIYLWTGRKNLWITIIAHGLLNTIRFVMVYTGSV